MLRSTASAGRGPILYARPVSDHHHHHDHSGPIAIGATAARIVVGLLTGIGVLVVIGAVVLWPSHQHIDIPLPMQNGGGGAVQTEAGTVTKQDTGPCGSQSNGKVFAETPQPPPNNSYVCARSLVAIESGPATGHHTLLEIAPGPGQPVLHQGDHIRVLRQNDPTGQPNYSFEDYSRGFPLTLVVLIFALVVVVVARWRGLRAVIGLVFAFVVLIMFMLPALLDGKPALPVAVVAGAIILYAVLYLAHGVNLRTSSALLGTLSAMVLATVLSWAALKITHVTGLSQEDNTNVATYVQHVSITGLLLAGFIIGSLGVLNDVTITQASAAFELAAIDEKATRREVFAAAMRVGRDHIASTVYTLVLAYAGGALPLLLMFSVAGRSLSDVITGDSVAIEIVRSAVGGICLALAVPLTTVIAVLLARPFSLKSAPEPPRRRPRPAKAVAGERPTRRGQDARPRRRAAEPQRHAEAEADPDDDEDYLHSLSQEEYRPTRPGRAATRRRPETDSASRGSAATEQPPEEYANRAEESYPRRRASSPAANQQPAEPYSGEQPASPRRRLSADPPHTGSQPAVQRPDPYANQWPDQAEPGYSAPDPTADPRSRRGRLSAEPSPDYDTNPTYDTGANSSPDWFADAAPPRHSGQAYPEPWPAADPYASDTYSNQWSGEQYPGDESPDYPPQPRPRLSGRPENTDTSGRHYRRDWPANEYDE
ncbi:YibE/F family protein [Nocardia sp. CA2R105]|nr:YibE/F family protein [Nocardia coffeae]